MTALRFQIGGYIRHIRLPLGWGGQGHICKLLTAGWEDRGNTRAKADMPAGYMWGTEREGEGGGIPSGRGCGKSHPVQSWPLPGTAGSRDLRQRPPPPPPALAPRSAMSPCRNNCQHSMR